jgi:hypothetical protein
MVLICDTSAVCFEKVAFTLRRSNGCVVVTTVAMTGSEAILEEEFEVRLLNGDDGDDDEDEDEEDDDWLYGQSFREFFGR